MEKLKELNEIKHTLIDAVKAQVASGLETVDTQELGEVVDMIKDFASAEKDCMEACYYEAIIDAMRDGGEEEGRYGYDRWRYASGRYAPKGRGTRTYGYLPSGDRMPAELGNYDPDYDTSTRRMGYHEGKETVEEIIDTMGDMWAKADTDMKRKIKTHVEDLLYQMNQEAL